MVAAACLVETPLVLEQGSPPFSHGVCSRSSESLVQENLGVPRHKIAVESAGWPSSIYLRHRQVGVHFVSEADALSETCHGHT